MTSTPPPSDDAARVLLGLGNTVDYEVEWVDGIVSELIAEHGVTLGDASRTGRIRTEADVLAALLGHLVTGSGDEHYVESAEVLAAFARRFPMRTTLGGTNVRAALAMRALGRTSTVHLVSTNADTRRLLPDDVRTISSATDDSLDPHVIVQFPAGARVVVGDDVVVTERANRVILTNDRPNRDLVVSEGFGDAVELADVVLVSGFNSIQESDVLQQRLAAVRRHVARRRPGAVAVYEHGAFHVPEFSDRVREAIGDRVDVWSCNEEELQAHLGRPVDLLSSDDVLAGVRAMREAVGVRTLVIHTRFWALAIGGPAAMRRAMVFGGVALAGARYAHGDAVTASHLAEAAGWPLQEEGARLAAEVEARDDEVTCLAAYRIVTATPTTIGLGDAFAGGLVAALADLASA